MESIRTKPYQFERGSESFQPATIWDPAEKIAVRESSPTLDNEGGNLGRFFGERNHHYHLDSHDDLEHVDMEVYDKSSRPLQIQVNILSNNTNYIPTYLLDYELSIETGRVRGFLDSKAEHHSPSTRRPVRRHAKGNAGTSDVSTTSNQLVNRKPAVTKYVVATSPTSPTVDVNDDRRRKRDKLPLQRLVTRGSSTENESNDFF